MQIELLRINGAINEKTVSMSAILTIKRLDIILLLESYQLQSRPNIFEYKLWIHEIVKHEKC